MALPLIVGAIAAKAGGVVGGFLWRQVKRFGGALFIGLLIWVAYSSAHRKWDNFKQSLINQGRVEQKVIDDAYLEKWQKEHPQITVGAGGQVITNTCPKDFKAIGIFIFGFKIGV
jgi:hypothetical protein